MADTVAEGGKAPRLDPDACVVVDRAELEAAADAAMKAADTLAVRQGVIGGLLAAALAVAARSLVGMAELDAGPFVALLVTASAFTMVWRIWDGRAVRFEVGVWSVASFAANLKNQWEEETQHG